MSEHNHNHEHQNEHGHEHHHIETGCCEHCHGHNHEHNHGDEKKEKIMLFTGVGLFAFAIIIMLIKKLSGADIGEIVYELPLLITAVLCGFETAKSGVKSLLNRDMSEALLMTISVLAAICIGEFFEAAAVALLFRIGEGLEDYASEKSKKSLESVFSIVSDTGHILNKEGKAEEIDADDIKVGMKLVLMPHEIVPVDGVIIKGETSIDTSALTGESVPVEVGEGSKIISGSKNLNNTVYYEATAVKQDSGAAKIVSMVEEATAKKGKSQQLINVFAKYYTPIVVVVAVLLFVIGWIASSDFKGWLHRALVLLVASCPCSVVLSVPLAFISSMGACAKNGMIIKGSNFIEEIAKAKAAAFDKTGTLTTDKPVAGKVYAAEGYTEEEVLTFAAKCEYYSTHPLARAVVEASGDVEMKYVSNYKEIPGGGTSIDTEKGSVLCGGQRLMKANNIDVSALPESSVYVALKGKAIGCIEIINEVREGAVKAIEGIKSLGITDITLLTGDTDERAREVASKTGINSYKSRLLPGDKLAAVEEIKNAGKGIIYVGDGINDAPVLAGANVGVAMGLGTQSACEAADVILTDSDLTKLCDTVKQSKKTMGIIKINIAFSLIIKLAVIILGIVLPGTPLWLAVIADVGTMIVCVLNSARLLKIQRT